MLSTNSGKISEILFSIYSLIESTWNSCVLNEISSWRFSSSAFSSIFTSSELLSEMSLSVTKSINSSSSSELKSLEISDAEEFGSKTVSGSPISESKNDSSGLFSDSI